MTPARSRMGTDIANLRARQLDAANHRMRQRCAHFSGFSKLASAANATIAGHPYSDIRRTIAQRSQRAAGVHPELSLNTSEWRQGRPPGAQGAASPWNGTVPLSDIRQT